MAAFSGCILSSPFPFPTSRISSFPRSKDPAPLACVTVKKSGVSTDPQENYPHQSPLHTIIASDNGSSASNSATQGNTSTSPNPSPRRRYGWESELVSDDDEGSLTLKDYFQQSKQMLRSDGGPPRWFSPLECASWSQQSPLLLFLPGYGVLSPPFQTLYYFCGV